MTVNLNLPWMTDCVSGTGGRLRFPSSLFAVAHLGVEDEKVLEEYIKLSSLPQTRSSLGTA
jgi:hypothetical protein